MGCFCYVLMLLSSWLVKRNNDITVCALGLKLKRNNDVVKSEDKTTTDSKVKSDIGDGTPNTVVMREIL